VSKLGYTDVIFIEPGAEMNTQYYREVLLMQELLPVIRSIAGDMFVFQQDNAPAHSAHVRSSSCAMRHLIHSANITDLNSVDYYYLALSVV